MYMTQPDHQRIQHIRDYCEEIRKTIERYGDTFFGALHHQFALDGVLQEGFFHIIREPTVELLQFAPRLFVAINIGQQLLDFGNNPLLLGEGWERKY